MTAAPHIAHDSAPLPGRGVRVLLDGLPGGPWSSVVVALRGDEIVLASPRLGGHGVPLPLRRAFRVAYSHREVPCEVDAELVSGSEPGDDATYRARLIGDPRRMQRRRAVRVPVHLIARADLGDDRDGMPFGAITENLSAAGALLRAARAIEAGAPLRVAVECGGEAGTLEIGGRVVRCDRVDVAERPWRIAVAFADLSGADEDRLVRYIFERQRELRRRDMDLR